MARGPPMLVGLLGLIGVVFVVLPLLSFVRSVQLGRELDAVRRRMDRPEARLSTAEPVAPGEAARVPPPAAPALVGFRPVPGHGAAASRDLDLEERIGGRWLQHAGLIVLLLGIAFFLRYAFEREWLSPPIRLGLRVPAGIRIAWGGVRLAARYRDYGLPLAGGGLAAPYLSFYSGLNLYALIRPPAALAHLVALTIVAAELDDRSDS